MRHRLTVAGLPDVPAVLSFAIGTAKPDDAFYHAVRHAIGDRGDAVFVDDQGINGAAARRHGYAGWTRTDVAATVANIRMIVAAG